MEFYKTKNFSVGVFLLYNGTFIFIWLSLKSCLCYIRSSVILLYKFHDSLLLTVESKDDGPFYNKVLFLLYFSKSLFIFDCGKWTSSLMIYLMDISVFFSLGSTNLYILLSFSVFSSFMYTLYTLTTDNFIMNTE